MANYSVAFVHAVFSVIVFLLRVYSKALNADAMKVMHFLFLTNVGAVLLVIER